MKLKKIFKGNLVFSNKQAKLNIIQNGLLGVDNNGKIALVQNDPSKLDSVIKENKGAEYIDLGKKFLIPGFIDTHAHSVQYPNIGTGTDLELLDWLNRYTFPTEKNYENKEFAKNASELVVKRVLKNGTTTCTFFSSIDLEATKTLADTANNIGLHAFIGKTCMDQNSPPFYIHQTNQEVEETRQFIEYSKDLKSPLINPIIIPRFAITCTFDLMKELGKLSNKYNVPVHTHLSENVFEVQETLKLFPGRETYTDIYEECGYLNNSSVFAHCIYLGEKEKKMFAKNGSAVAHCPLSNFTLNSGVLNVRELLDRGIKVGLGTDMSGGYSPSMYNAIRNTVIASNVVSKYTKDVNPLSFEEAFHLATIGGAEVLGISHLVGDFGVGKMFNAQVLDPSVKDSPIDVFAKDDIKDIFQKLIFLSDDRNITDVYVNGNKINL
eukprot:TRINITY_DN7738_c0_g1_i1.p1 TRINITY_DN7738_c0_g1~~TRINITY_DN7738_c0_g1_i1.p1  ORF type:complete len:437 (-),score=127.50 TRINITY_DN7738_c0_g1_i1:54-1364(-)